MSGTVLVTGASRGLGLAIARRLAAEGYDVIAASRGISPELQALCRESRVSFAPLDLLKTGTLHGYCREVTRAHGPLWGLVNNAAIAPDGVLATMHEREISELIQVNVTSTILLTKYALRSMLLKRKGRIVNISSVIASTGYNGLSVYGASKAALVGFTRSLAREVGKAGITVNAVAPGYMDTSMTSGLDDEQLDSIERRSAMRTRVSPDDVAGSVAYLLGPDGARVTGTVVTVDAGSTA